MIRDTILKSFKNQINKIASLSYLNSLNKIKYLHFSTKIERTLELERNTSINRIMKHHNFVNTYIINDRHLDTSVLIKKKSKICLEQLMLNHLSN